MDDLTPSQRQAVEHVDGPLLVLAGPGSGKTRVITRRIARLVEHGISERTILAITFTNKAANEMQSRVASLLPGTRVWVSTFHRFCARLLRMHAEAVGLKPNFTIVDTSDQRQLLKRALNELNIDAVHYNPGKIAARISNAKNDLITAEIYARNFNERVGHHLEAVVGRVYPRYQQLLLQSNAVDFDDLLVHAAILLSENPELRESLDARYEYVLVDEYQDTNLAQYRIVAALSQDYPNLCVTGDPDQSIYSWRGAQIDNILRFESEYPSAKVVRLEENFRSTQRILEAAEQLIEHNVHRKRKSLVTSNAPGRSVELLTFHDAEQEAEILATEIERTVADEGHSYGDIAVFYRVNALSREIERALVRHRIPYQVAAGVAYFERAEIKDVLAYLRVLTNSADESAFVRIVNTPARGISKKTVAALTAWAQINGLTLMDAAAAAEQIPSLSKRAAKAAQSFAAMMQDLSDHRGDSVEALLRNVIERTGYAHELRAGAPEQEEERLANVEELITVAQQYDQRAEEDASLEGFLESMTLVGETDNLDESAERVTLMTLHAAKGLEFPVVYIVAVEQKLLPHERAIESGDLREYEEERRLLFVGMTRAEQKLSLTQTRERTFRGRRLATITSQFLGEIPLVARDFSLAPRDLSIPHDDELSQELLKAPTATSSAIPRALLTTGADLLNGTGKEALLPIGFAIGATVRHPIYGLGTVVNAGGFARRRSVTVEFHGDGHTETFIVSKSPLQPVG